MSTPLQRVLTDIQVRRHMPIPRPADGVGHLEWAEELTRERAYHQQLADLGHQPSWADHLRLHTAAALAATDAATLRRELLDLAGTILGWVEDLDARPRPSSTRS